MENNFNALLDAKRTAIQLQNQWKNAKAKVKKTSTFKRRELFKTGGGISVNVKVDENDEAVQGKVLIF